MKKILLSTILLSQFCFANDVILDKDGITVTKAEVMASYNQLSDSYKDMITKNPAAFTDIITDLFVNKEIAKKVKPELEKMPDFKYYQSNNEAKFLTNLSVYNKLNEKLKEIDFDKQAKEYYTVNKDKFKSKPTYDLYQIGFLKENNLSTADPKKKAEEVLKEIQDKKITFADAAKKYNLALLGNNTEGQLLKIDPDTLLPEIKTAVNKLKEDESTGIIESNIAYHIFYLIKKHPAVQQEFTKELEEKITKERRNSFMRQFYLSEKEEYKKLKDVKINEDLLNSLLEEVTIKK